MQIIAPLPLLRKITKLIPSGVNMPPPKDLTMKQNKSQNGNTKARTVQIVKAILTIQLHHIPGFTYSIYAQEHK